MVSFFSALKQRRIVQIVASYAVSGWVVLEVLGVLIERGILPDVLYRVGLVIYLGGLAASVVAGWYHGEKGHQEMSRPEIALLAVIFVVTGVFTVRVATDARAAVIAERSGESGRLRLERVAVLGFSDRSRDGSLGYLSEGLTESLVERLEGVQGLDVVSRTGSEQFRGSNLPLDSIATVLSAGTLLDGWIEPRGAGVRVHVALYDGEGGAEINRQSFDRPADEVFDLQDELAREVAELLRGWLGRELTVRSARRGTGNTQAWITFQRARGAHREAETALASGDLAGFIASHTRADSLFSVAEQMDGGWADPTIQRAILASRWGELSAADEPAEAREYLDRARDLATAALDKDRQSAWAYYVRGTVNYQVWLLGLASSARESDALFEQARSDLEEATAKDRTLANAYSTLSILYSQIPDPVNANLAARQALDADEFLRNADSVLRRLYQTSYDIEQFREAIQYCNEGRRRFPDQPEFVQCRLWLLGAPRGLEHDPDAAWSTMEEHLALVPPDQREMERARDQILVAMVLARGNRPDSARAVLTRVEDSPALDPSRELLGVKALVHLALGDTNAALDELRVYLTASPEHRAGWQWSSHWWWRPLQANPEFQRLIGR